MIKFKIKIGVLYSIMQYKVLYKIQSADHE